MQLWIYTSNQNNRKSYILSFIFNSILGVNFRIINDETDFNNYNGPKISYTNAPLSSEIHFTESSFINETKIEKFNLAFADWEDLKIPFAVENSVFPFDVFAASFYFLSRYEEYIISDKDEHQRFEGKSSLAYQNNFIYRPLIDEWAYLIAQKIKNYHHSFEIKARKFEFIPTLDIDRPYYFKTDQPIKRLAKQVLKGLLKDPFDIYDLVKTWDKKFNLQTKYFLLVANKHQFDGAPDQNHPLFINFLKNIGLENQIGIHPSYSSNFNNEEIKEEKKWLKETSKQEIEISRQHYLMLAFPKTYRNLINANIKADYTLTFADTGGFRASTCTPFYWYDLEQEKITDLKLFPTTMMDQTLKKYLGLTPDESIELIKLLIKNTKAVNGTFISLWHNESINNFNNWKGWQKVYLEMMEMAGGNL
jgi:hypothetical protein